MSDDSEVHGFPQIRERSAPKRKLSSLYLEDPGRRRRKIWNDTG